MASDSCDVYIDQTIPALSVAFFHVSFDNDGIEDICVPVDVVYRFESKDPKSKLMDEDAVVKVGH